MEEIFNNELLYIGEHLTCANYMRDITTGFIYRELEAGAKDRMGRMEKNYLAIVLEGSIRLNYEHYPEKTVGAGEMVLLFRSAFGYSECLTDTRLLILAFDNLSVNCDKLFFQAMTPLIKESKYALNTLSVKHPLQLFIDLLVYYLQNGANCAHLHEMKRNELFLCLRYFYTKEELASFFYPILSPTMNFKQFVLEHYPRVHQIQELIELSNMGKTTFYEKFKTEFGMTAKQWMTKEFSHKLLYTAAEPGITVKELGVKLGFNSLSQFQQYCKRHYKCTPSELIRSRYLSTPEVYFGNKGH